MSELRNDFDRLIWSCDSIECPLAVGWSGKIVLLANIHCNWNLGDVCKVDLVTLEINEISGFPDHIKMINLLERSCVHEPHAVMSLANTIVSRGIIKK
jgi:hypothetical protein